MAEDTEPNQHKRRRRWPWITLIVILAFIAIVRLAMRTDFVFNFIRGQVEQTAGETLNGELNIESMRGDLWNRVEARGISLTQSDTGQDTLVTVDSLKVTYSILTLLSSPFVVRSVDLYGVNSYLAQEQDSTWNFEKVLPEQQEEQDTETDPFPLLVERVQIHGSNIFATAPFMLPDTTIQVRDINMLASFELYEEGFSFDLDNFELNVHEKRLGDPIRFETTASGDTTAIQLDRLVIAGGASLFEVMGNLDLENEEVDVSALFDPLSWRTIRAYAEDVPFNQDVTLNLSIEGELNDLRAQLNATSTGLEELTLMAALSFGSDPALTNFSMNGSNVDFAVLLDDPGMPSFGRLESSFDGFVSFENYENGTLDGSLNISNLRMDPYVIDRLALNLELRESEIFTNLELNRSGGVFFTQAHVTDFWSEMPGWTADYEISRINPAVWASDQEMEGMINAEGALNGQGLEFSGNPVYFRLNLRESHYQGQVLESGLALGWINNENLEVESEFHTQRNSLTMNANAAWAAAEPTYSFTVNAREFDLSEFMMEDTLSTRLNLNITGDGRNYELDKMNLSAVMNMDSSFVNNEQISDLRTNVTISDSVLVMDDFVLNSQFASGNLFIRQNLIRYNDLENNAEFNIQLLDLQSFAELAGADTLRAGGSFNGSIAPDRFDRLALNLNLDLNNIAYDTLTIEGITGRITSSLDDNPDYDVDLSVDQSRLGDYEVENVRLLSAGSYINEILTGNYSLGLAVDSENGLRQEADIRYDNEILRLTTKELDLISEEGNYILQNPFDIVYANELINIDTLSLRGERTGATVQLALDQYGPESFRGNFEADYINLGLLQDIVLNEIIFDGILMTQADFDIQPEQMNISSESILSDFTYGEALMLDTLHLGLNLADDRLQTEFNIHKDLQTLVTSEFNLPFVLTDPEELDDEFFQEPVSGLLEIQPLALEMFSSALEQFGYESSTGTISLSSALGGTAGSPTFDGNFTLSEALLSEIPIQEFSVNWDYDHDISNLSLSSFLDTETQRAFDLNGEIPFYVDFHTFEFAGPQDDDELNFNFRSDNFNLAVFNDFLDPETAEGLRGNLNADVMVRGPLDNLAIEGFLRLREGRVRAVPNEITFRDISTDITLQPGKIVLEQASVRSAGSLTGRGEILLDGLTPGNFNLRFDAQNFRVYATRDIDAYIGTGARLQGTLDEPRLSGDIRLERGTIYLDDFGESQVEEVVLEEDAGDDELIPEVETSFYENLAMEMNFSVTRTLNLRNRDNPEMDLTLSGELDLVKLRNQELEVFGDISIPNGYATTFGKRFEIDSGSIIFSGNPENPQMDIRTIYQPRQQEGTRIEIYYTISGTVEEPEFAYDSDPEMEFQDIVSYTLFGRPFNALAGFEQGAAGRAEGDFVSEMAMEVLLDRVEALAAEQIGIDVLEIDNNRRGPGSGTSIKAGKFLTDRVFVAFLQELGGTEAGRQVIIEYMIRRNLDLIITGSDDHRSGVDIMWRLDY